MGKDLLKPLQIYLSKFRGSKQYVVSGKEDGSWIFSCKQPRTESLRLERASKSGGDVYKNYNSLYSGSDEGSRALVPLPEEEEEEENCEPEKIVMAVQEANKCSKKAWCVEADEEEENYEAEKIVMTVQEANKCSKRAWCIEEDSDFFGVSSKSSSDSSRFFSDSSRSSDLPPDLASGLSSQRFFFSPGRSNSILEEAKCYKADKCPLGRREKIDLPFCEKEESSDREFSDSSRWELVKNPSSTCDFSGVSSESCHSETDMSNIFRSESVAVHMNSPNPYRDFRVSMQEMVEAHSLTDWQWLQEMLFCYLSLNHKRTHKFILVAFADLVTSIFNTRNQTPLLEHEEARSDAE